MYSKKTITLNKASPGNLYKIKSVRLEKTHRKRISDLGMISGTVIKVLQRSPLGDPTAYLVRGSVIALRNDYTRRITVQKYS